MASTHPPDDTSELALLALVDSESPLQPTPVHVPQADDGDDAHDAASVATVLCHWARRRGEPPELLRTLKSAGVDVADLVAEGIFGADALARDDGWETAIGRLVDLWWLDLRGGITTANAVGRRLSAEQLDILEKAAFAVLEARDRFDRPSGHLDLQSRFIALVEPRELADADVDAAAVIARGLAWVLGLRMDDPAPAVAWVRSDLSIDVGRAIARDLVLLKNARFIGALLFRGDTRGRALAAASLYFAGKPTIEAIRNDASIAPVSDLLRLAETHGLLGLAADGSGTDAAAAVRNALRGALLVHVFCGDALGGMPWWRVFRGEEALAASLNELGASRDALARDIAAGLPMRLEGRGLRDTVVREAIALCLCDVLSRDVVYSAPLRLTESRIKEWRHDGETERAQDGLRDYARTLVVAARRLLDYGKKPIAEALYARVIRLRGEFPGVLMPDIFPDRLERAIELGETDGLARRLRVEYEHGSAGTQRPSARRAPEDPLGQPADVVAAVSGTEPLPIATAVWAGAIAWTPIRLLDGLVPLPLRRIATRFFRFMGATPSSRLLLSAEGDGVLHVTQRLFGVPVYRERHAVPAHRVFVFPTDSPRADRLLGRWAALLVALSTIGTWLFLKASDDVGRLLAGCLIGGSLLGYIGALSLHRVVSRGLAMVVLDEKDRPSVWSLRPEDRGLLVQYAERAIIESVAKVVPHDPASPLPKAQVPSNQPR
ncbi:MAG: hypothetical protein IV100_26765 [Myxococcales bacterium]|nr:hypothetical protein [Myxococcales bacterium]